ncbi:MAG: coenzyme F420-0:L-glutamate ligase [Bdellovibrionota bacterium]
MKKLSVQPIQTSIFREGDLAEFIIQSIPKSLVQEEMVLAITSKIVSVAENRFISRDKISKEDLVKQEADVFLGEIGYGCFLTIKDGLLIPSAGIDESNSEQGDYILYPENPFQSAEKLWLKLRERWQISKLGIVLTDSHTTPLRRGVTGIALSYWGFQPLRKLIGTKDLFGRELQMTNMNLADGIAASTVLMMGEGSESTPLAIVEGLDLEFCEVSSLDELSIPLAEDLYGPILSPYISKI